MKKQPIKHHTDGLIALLLFGVFSVCVLAVLLTGADAYRRLTDRDQAAYDQRTCIQYIATRIRQADRRDGVRVEEFCGLDALVLADTPDNDAYITRVYYYDGYIMELFCEAALELPPEAGSQIMPANALSFSQEGDLLTITATDASGRENALILSLRSGEEAAG